MAEFVGAFPSTLALDDSNNVVRDAEAYVYDVNDVNLASPLPVTDLEGVPFTGGKLVASNGIFPQFRAPVGVLQVYVKSGGRVTQITDLSVFADASRDSAARAEDAASSAQNDRVAAQAATADAVEAAARAEAVGAMTDAVMASELSKPASASRGVVLGVVGEATDTAVSDPSGVASKLFSRGDQAYNVTTPSLRRFRTALAGAEPMNNNTQRSARVLCAWNSIVFGAGLNAIAPNFPAQLSAMFAREFPSAGTGIVHLGTPGNFQQDGANAVDNRINRVGAWTPAARGAFGAGALRATGVDKKLVFTEVGIEFVVYFARSEDGGVAAVQVDGGATATIDMSGTGLGSYTIVNTAATSAGGSALADAQHVVTITAPASGYATLTGVEARRSRGGVRVTRAAQSGAHTATLLVNDESMAAVFDQAQPDLTILLELINDWLNIDLPVATFKSRWAEIIRRAKVTGDVLLVVPPISNETGTFPFEAYEAALYELADEYDCVLVNIRARWGTFAEANAAGLMSDAYHPSYKGYRDLARAVYEVIGAKAPGSTIESVTLGGAQTFTGRKTFGDGLVVPAGKPVQIGEANISRDAPSSMTVNGFWKAQRGFFGATVPANLGAINARASAGVRALSAQGADGVERAGFDNNGRLFVHSGDIGGSAPAAPTRSITITDNNGVTYAIGAVPL